MTKCLPFKLLFAQTISQLFRTRLVVFVGILLVPLAVQARTYSTVLPYTENPLRGRQLDRRLYSRH
jgi:hypothetical protein